MTCVAYGYTSPNIIKFQVLLYMAGTSVLILTIIYWLITRDNILKKTVRNLTGSFKTEHL